jgi:S-adenosylmethionine decarboxylase
VTTTTVGTHCVLELYGCPGELLNDPVTIREALRNAAETARSTLLAEVLHPFEPQGVTALALLAESHISIHTWPEHGYAAIDVFTCGEHTRPEQACEHLARALHARKFNLRKLPRGQQAPAGTFVADRSPAQIESGMELAEAVEEPFQCQVLRFERTSGSTSTSLPGTSTSTG